jgi:hypothetical protein
MNQPIGYPQFPDKPRAAAAAIFTWGFVLKENSTFEMTSALKEGSIWKVSPD